MNRQIKFRGKTKDGKWIYGSLLVWKNGDCEIIAETCCAECDKISVIPETVGQYTGLKDKNGIEIFEGDVVKWDDCSDGRYWRIAVVQLNPDIQFDCSSISRYGEIKNSSQHIFRFGNFIYKDTHNHLYVLGNVHDNLELIK